MVDYVKQYEDYVRIHTDIALVSMRVRYCIGQYASAEKYVGTSARGNYQIGSTPIMFKVKFNFDLLTSER